MDFRNNKTDALAWHYSLSVTQPLDICFTCLNLQLYKTISIMTSSFLSVVFQQTKRNKTVAEETDSLDVIIKLKI